MKSIVLLFILSMSAQASTLVLIGGGNRPAEALSVFVQRTQSGPIAVLPWGTEKPVESYNEIKSQLAAFGARNVICFCAAEFTSQDYKMLMNAGGIYFPGGDQNKVMDRILRAGIKGLLQSLFFSGVPVAGTSAGTAIQTDPMLTGFGSQTAQGLGLLPNFIVDQHFIVRNREERLLQALQAYPHLNGMGIDENMSAVIENSNQLTAIGPSLVSIYVRENGQLNKIVLSDHQSLRL